MTSCIMNVRPQWDISLVKQRENINIFYILTRMSNQIKNMGTICWYPRLYTFGRFLFSVSYYSCPDLWPLDQLSHQCFLLPPVVHRLGTTLQINISYYFISCHCHIIKQLQNKPNKTVSAARDLLSRFQKQHVKQMSVISYRNLLRLPFNMISVAEKIKTVAKFIYWTERSRWKCSTRWVISLQQCFAMLYNI